MDTSPAIAQFRAKLGPEDTDDLTGDEIAEYDSERTWTVPYEEVAHLFPQPYYDGSESRVWSDNSLDAPPDGTLQAEADAIAAEMKEEEHWRQRAHHLHACTGGQNGRTCFTCGKVA